MSISYDRFTGSDEHRVPPADEEEAWAALLEHLEENLAWQPRRQGGQHADTPGGDVRIIHAAGRYAVWVLDQHGCEHQRVHEGPTLDEALEIAANFEPSRPGPRR